MPALALILPVFLAVAWFRIFKRLGWSGWWGLTMFVAPVAIIVVSAVMYFQRWPIETRLEELEIELERVRAQLPPAS